MEDIVRQAGHHKNFNITNGTLLVLQNSSSMQDQQLVSLPLPFYVTIMVLIDIVGIIGNSLVLFVIILKKKRMQTYTNWMILNLAVSDLAVTLFCIPLDIPLLVEGKWIYGELFCSIYYALGSAQLFSSVFTLVNITYVRYLAICYPFNEQPSVFNAKIMIVVIRVCSIALVIPMIFVLRYDEESQMCYENWNETSQMYYTVAVFLLGFATPLAIITIGYCCIVKEIVVKKNNKEVFRDSHIIKENRMLVKLSVAVTVTFAICVLPNQLVFILYTFVNLESYKHHLDLLLGSHVMLFLYCALNPIIYNICSDNFRKGVKDLLNKFLNKLSLKQESITSL